MLRQTKTSLSGNGFFDGDSRTIKTERRVSARRKVEIESQQSLAFVQGVPLHGMVPRWMKGQVLSSDLFKVF
jgi:nucleoid DNA-binding protein